jgi:multiple sugar transport system permease protein
MAVASQTTAPPRGSSKSRYTTLSFWAMVAPLAVGLIIFTYLPIIWGFLLSIYDSRGTVKLTKFVGLANYQAMLSSPEFQKSMVTVIQFAIFIVPTTFALSLFLAVLVQNAPFFKGFFRSVFFIPTAISYVIASMIWRMSIFNGVPSGLINQVLWVLFEHDPITWIGTPNPPWYWLVLVTVRLWLQVGFYMIIFIAGMQAIPTELYEAARVDGAESKWILFWKITFPLLRNTSIFILLINIIHAFNAFAEFFNILGGTYASSGGLLAMARPPLIYLYQVAMSQQDYGRGTAGAFILAVIIIGATLVQNKISGGMGQEVY